MVGECKAGVFWVGLASLRDPALVLQTIAQTLGAKEELEAHIGERELLLLLDNLEQVIDAAPEVAALVEACPNLRSSSLRANCCACEVRSSTRSALWQSPKRSSCSALVRRSTRVPRSRSSAGSSTTCR